MKTLFCTLLLTGALSAADATGKWSGAFTGVRPDGSTRESTAFLVLKQQGGTISGTVGPTEGEQHQILQGKIDGDKITFEVRHPPRSASPPDPGVAKFELTLAGDRITGNARVESEGRTMVGKIDVTRKAD